MMHKLPGPGEHVSYCTECGEWDILPDGWYCQPCLDNWLEDWRNKK